MLLFLCTESTNHSLVDKQAIFANNELGMRHIDVYGFDYDYTLASYSNALHFLIYDLAVKELIATYGVSSLIKIIAGSIYLININQLKTII